MTPSVLFVCLGNICRSPLAEGVFRDLAAREGVAVRIDSAGTGDWHLGHAPDKRAQAVAAKNRLDISGLRARLVTEDDFRSFDHIIAMDSSNLANLQAMRPADATAAVAKLLDYAPETGIPDVPDPYYGGPEGFDETYALVEAGAKGLLDAVRK
ncbi:low molecular weight protein-tyrosine-phosphatase [Sphingoaurantiacus capsulatus]|uniref:protein-tyrosine-phosphatase n=1 Tax=Sphingoaurantiacus capsulatus TaxID=1771310 RepID=A0ABV7X603_9SPHN